jgi:hypothetical protein
LADAIRYDLTRPNLTDILGRMNFSASGNVQTLRSRIETEASLPSIPAAGEMGFACLCGLIWRPGGTVHDEATPDCDGWLCSRLDRGMTPPFHMVNLASGTYSLQEVLPSVLDSLPPIAKEKIEKAVGTASTAAAPAIADRLQETPGRKRLREEASESIRHQANRMQRIAESRHGANILEVGTVVRVSVDDVDRARTDAPTATFVIVDAVETGEVQKEIKYKLACKAGVLKTLYCRSYVDPVPNATAALVGLDTVLDSWRGLPQDVSMRMCMRSLSSVGGQGMVRCDCKGGCNKNTCSCFKAGRKCNSRCHKGSTTCTNHDQ